MSVSEPDILLIDEFLSNSALLFDDLRTSVDWDTSMAARHTASYGEPYNYSQMTYEARPMPPSLAPVAERLEERLKVTFNNCLLNFYLSGEGTGVAIVSLGSQRGITYRNKADKDVRHTFPLAPGSLLYMDSEVQDHWTHAIRKESDAGPRISLTWRAFRKAG